MRKHITLGRLGLPVALVAGLLAMAPTAGARPAGAATPASGEQAPDSRTEVTPVPEDQEPPVDTGPTDAGRPVDHALPPVPMTKYRAMQAAAWNRPVDRWAQAVPIPAAAPSGVQPLATVDPPCTGLNREQSADPAGTLHDPPDTIVANSSSRVLEAVNTRLRLTNLACGVLSEMSLNAFFSAPIANGHVFDPKVYFDRGGANPRYYVVGLQESGAGDANPANDVSRIHLAISRSANPNTLAAASWCRYNLDGRRNVGTALASSADYPGIGIGADTLNLSTNQFTFAPDANGFLNFTFAVVRAFNKVTAANNAAACPVITPFTFQASGVAGDGNAFTLQPAQHYTNPSSFAGTTNPTYLVNTNFGAFNTYRVWRIRNVAAGNPTMQNVTVAGNVTYGLPPDSPGGVLQLIDTGDVRVLQTAGVGNALTAVHTTACQFAPSPAPEACWRSVRITVGQAINGLPTTTMAQQQVVGGGDNQFLHHPGVAVNNLQETAFVFQSNVPANVHRLSSNVTTQSLGGALSPSAPLGTGNCFLETGFDPAAPYRSGDYTGAQTATDADAFWVAAEHAQFINGVCQWATRFARVTHP